MTPQTMVLEDGTRITVIHLAVMNHDQESLTIGDPTWRLACAPNVPDLSANGRMAPLSRSDDPRSVNCPLCLKSAAYIAAMERIRAARRNP